MKEIWKIINYKKVKKNMYSISNKGRIKNIITKKILKPWKSTNGYRYATLMKENNKPCHIGVHILVAVHFITIPEELKILNEKLVPNHNDFDRENNYVTNLSWMTYSMNNKYNLDNGHVKMGDECPNSKISNEKVHIICHLLEIGKSNTDIIQEVGLKKNGYSTSLITRIRNGSEWKSISSQYNITVKNSLRQTPDDVVIEICEMLSKGYSLAKMRNVMGIDNDDKSKKKFKNLVTSIRLRRSFKDISKNYNW